MDGLSLHKKAEEAREQGNFLEALKFTDEASCAYQKEGNAQKLAEVQSSRALTLRHLFETTGDKNYLILAKYAAKSGVKIAESLGSEDASVVALYTLGKCYESFAKYDKAKESIVKAIELAQNSKPSEIAEMQTRLASIEYRLGDVKAMGMFEQALSDLASAEEDSYNKNVWVSGAHMHIAEAMLSKGEKEKAAEELKKAEQIVNGDSRLILRKQQLTKLLESI